jgi:hypothetical protein
MLRDSGLSYAESVERPYPIALHLWRSGGRVHVLVGNLETGEFGDSRTPRTVHLRLSRSQLGLDGEAYQLVRFDVSGESTISDHETDARWLTFTLDLPPEQAAVYVLQPA